MIDDDDDIDTDDDGDDDDIAVIPLFPLLIWFRQFGTSFLMKVNETTASMMRSSCLYSATAQTVISGARMERKSASMMTLLLSLEVVHLYGINQNCSSFRRAEVCKSFSFCSTFYPSLCMFRLFYICSDRPISGPFTCSFTGLTDNTREVDQDELVKDAPPNDDDDDKNTQNS